MSDVFDVSPLRHFRYPVHAECISPDVFDNNTVEEIEQLKVWEGNSEKALGELFKVQRCSEKSENGAVIRMCGDLSEVRRIGACMTNGELTIQGNVGMHLGEEMKGGKVSVRGNVGPWAGSMMRGGTIEVYGDCGDYLGAPYRGSSAGICGDARITVHGNVGNECGAHLKNGIIRIYGCAGQFAGFRTHGGTLYIADGCAGRAGASMTDGRIIVGGHLESLLPTFIIDGIRSKLRIEEEIIAGSFLVFLGDRADNGKAKLYVSKETNPELNHFEKLL